MTPNERFDAMVPIAMRVSAAVHGDGDAAEIASLYCNADLPALVIVLAALVPTDRTRDQLLAWLDVDPKDEARRIIAMHRNAVAISAIAEALDIPQDRVRRVLRERAGARC